MKFDERIKLNIFEGKTTYRNDYRQPEREDKFKYRWEQDRFEKEVTKIVKPKQECHETFAPFRKEVYVPFNLLHEPKPIIGPLACTRTKPSKFVDKEKEAVIKSRPRLYIAPALSIDDVPNKEMRDLLISYMYTTDFRNSEKEAVSFLYDRKKKERENKRASLCCCSEQNDNENEFKFMVCDMPRPYMKKGYEAYPPISGDLRRNYDEWDTEQKRATVEPTIRFWEEKGPSVKGPYFNPMDELVPQQLKDEIAEVIKENKLRYAHDITPQGYTGYKQKTGNLVPLRKAELPVFHPMLTTNQAVNIRKNSK